MDVAAFRAKVPIIDYIKRHYSDRMPIDRESSHIAYCHCIFHSENTASMAIYDDGRFKCFGCGEYGDLIDIVKQQENTDFIGAVKIIAKNENIPLELSQESQAVRNYKETMDGHTRRYYRNLVNDKQAMDFLEKRGLDEETMLNFRIGLTDKNEYKFRNDIGNISDRISIPILSIETKPHCIGMAYRVFRNETKPKYINDHNQDGMKGRDPTIAGVFIKNKNLFGMAQGLKTIKRNGLAYITEGYFDVMLMHRVGFTNTVCMMGSSISEEQAALISKYADKAILIMDGDEAGRNKIMHNLTMLYSQGVSADTCILYDKMDPADLCMKHKFNHVNIADEIFECTTHGIEYMTDAMSKKYRCAKITNQQEAMKNYENIAQYIKNVNDRALLKRIFMRKIDL